MEDRHTFDPLLPPKRFIGAPGPDYTPLIPIGRSNWFAGVKSGKFPEADVRLGARTVLWRRSTIERLVAELEAATAADKEAKKPIDAEATMAAATESGRAKSQATSNVEV